MALSYYLPLYFQSVLLASPILSGVYVLPSIITLSIFSTANGFLVKKTGRYRESIVGGMFLLVLGVGLFIDLKSYASWPRIIIYQIIAGIGAGPNFQSPLVAFQANNLPKDMAVATAAFAFIRQLSTAVSVVIGGVIYQNILTQQASSVVEPALGPAKAGELSSSFVGSDKPFVLSLPSARQRQVVLGAISFSLSRMWIFYTAIAAIGFLFSLFVRPIELSKRRHSVKLGLHRDGPQEEKREMDVRNSDADGALNQETG